MNDDLLSILKTATIDLESKYVGLKYLNDRVQVFFPLGYEIPTDLNLFRESVIKLIRTINISNKILQENRKLSMKIGENKEIPINSYIWILNDYFKNGIYHDNEKTYNRGINGKINWKKTINTEYYISKNNLIYLKPVIEKSEINDNIITDIHAFCINRSIKYIGWLYGKIEKLKTNIDKKNINYYKSVLNKELAHAFDDRKKQLLINLIKIMNECGGNKNSKLNDYGTYEYNYVWEYMVNYIFGNERVDNFLPSTRWKILNNEKMADSNLYPDTIFTIDKEDIYILDSKYYKYGITKEKKDLPHTESIQKQITYGEHIDKSDKYNFSKIYNAFILPYNKSNNSFELNNNIEYIGFAESSWKENTTNLYEHIALILVDTKYLIDSYFKNKNDNVFEMVSEIQKIVNTFKE